MNTNILSRSDFWLSGRAISFAGLFLAGLMLCNAAAPGLILAQEEPAADAPPAETPAAEAAPEAQPAEAQPADAPPADAPAETPAADAPAEAPAEPAPTEPAPAADAPAADAPAAEAPAAEARAETPPATDTPVVDAPATEAPATNEAPATEAPVQETSSTDPGETSTGEPIDPTKALDTEESTAVAATEIVEEMPTWKILSIGLGVLALIVVPYVIGTTIAEKLRMPDHGWKLGLILGTLLCGSVIVAFGWPPKLGPDLSGGINLIYEIDPSVETKEDFTIDQMINALILRVNPGGVKEVTIRPYGQNQVEIIIPKAGEAELSSIKRQISTAGSLQFRITANYKDHEELIQQAFETEGNDILDDGELLGHWSFIDLNRFNLVVNSNEKEFEGLIERARATSGSAVGERNRVSAYWLPVAPSEIPAAQRSGAVLRRTLAGELEVLLLTQQTNDAGGFVLRTDPQGRPQVLMAIDEFNVTGAMLDAAAQNVDEHGRLAVGFTFKSSGAGLFSRLTTKYGPDASGFHRHLGILLDDTLLSAPTLNEPITGGHGQISGNFNEEDITFLVSILNAGSLPAALNKVPISEQTTSPELGIDTVRQGATAMIASMAVVVLFMLVYYRFSGILACCALIANIILILAVMIAFKAAFSLPGLAGMVLTVGMAVDANVLIFERMREELSRGTALRMAIRNGFERATTAIVDSNVTTLITAVVLFWIGTDQIKGFAVTLFLGIVMSMFTAIFCTRVIFEIAEKQRWITELRMMRIFSNTNFDFMGKRYIAIACSLVLIAIGLVAIVARGRNVLDIDFVGGSSVTVQFQQPQEIGSVRAQVANAIDTLEARIDGVKQEAEKARPEVEQEVRARLENDPAFREKPPAEQTAAVKFDVDRTISARFPEIDVVVPVDVSVVGIGEGGLDYKIDTSILDFNLAQRVLSDEFGDKLLRNSLNFKLGTATGTPSSSNEKPAEKTSQLSRPPADQAAAVFTPLPGDHELASASDVESLLLAQNTATDAAPVDAAPAETPDAEAAPADTAPAEAAPAEAAPADAAPAKETPAADADAAPATEESSTEATAPATKDAATEETVTQAADSAAPAAVTQAELTFGQPLNRESVSGLILTAMEQDDIPSASFQVTSKDVRYTEGSDLRLNNWNVNLAMNPELTQKLLGHISAAVSKDPVFPSSSNIGGKVAGDTQMLAAYAMFISLLAIVAYIWFRFSSVMFGLAAVVALVHDVLIMLGMIALSYYLVQSVPWLATPLQLDPFKISLPIVAALLTVIGYSLNDTIIIFDRIREVRGKSPELTSGMMNLSINQTLSRTTLTSLTTLFVVVILYFAGGPGIHGFAFALVVGVIAGTYSTIFVACPVLDWLMNSKSTASHPPKKTAAVAR